MKFFSKKRNGGARKGFSLLEMIIYVVLLSMLLVAIINMFIVMAKSWDSIRLDKDMASSVSTALERMTREIKDADSVNVASSTFNTSPGKLVLNVYTSGGATTSMAFYLYASSTLEIYESGASYPIILPDTSITNLVFRHITTGQSEAVKIEMQMQTTYMGKSKTANFYDTAVVRGSYQD